MALVEKEHVAGWVMGSAAFGQRVRRQPFVEMVEEQAAVLASTSLPMTRCSAGSGS